MQSVWEMVSQLLWLGRPTPNTPMRRSAAGYGQVAQVTVIGRIVSAAVVFLRRIGRISVHTRGSGVSKTFGSRLLGSSTRAQAAGCTATVVIP